MDLNALKQYMDFFKQNGLGGGDYSAHNGFNPTPNNEGGAAADWAMRMMGPQGGQQADVSGFFGGSGNPAGGGGYSPSTYVAPQRAEFSMPSRPPQQSPMTGQVNNYLARLIGRR